MKYIVMYLLAGIYFSASAQSNEYLVRSGSDTIFGSNIRLDHKVFTIQSDHREQAIPAAEVTAIKSPRFKGTVVVSCILQRYIDDYVFMERNYAPILESDTVLVLTEEFKGPKMNMYMGTDNWKVQYYFYKTPSDPQPVQLVVRYMLSGGVGSQVPVNLKRYDNDTHLAEMKGYVSQLQRVMSDCKKITDDNAWLYLTYRLFSLRDLIRRYNKCN